MTYPTPPNISLVNVPAELSGGEFQAIVKGTGVVVDGGTSGVAMTGPVTIDGLPVTGGNQSPLTTKGDLYTYSTEAARLPVGTNGQVLVADDAEDTGLKWASSPPAGAGGSNTQIQFNDSGNLNGSASLAWSGSALTLAGDFTISGTTKRIHGDFSNSTASNRTLFQSSTTNGSTILGAIPNGTGTSSSIQFDNNSSASASAFGSIGISSSAVTVTSGTRAGGTALPLRFNTGTSTGTTRLEISTAGAASFSGSLAVTGTTTLTGVTTVNNTLSVNGDSNLRDTVNIGNGTTVHGALNLFGDSTNNQGGGIAMYNANGNQTHLFDGGNTTTGATYAMYTPSGAAVTDSGIHFYAGDDSGFSPEINLYTSIAKQPGIRLEGGDGATVGAQITMFGFGENGQLFLAASSDDTGDTTVTIQGNTPNANKVGINISGSNDGTIQLNGPLVLGTNPAKTIAFFGSAGGAQPAAIADATNGTDVITQLNLLLAAMRTLGLIAT